VWGTLSGAIPNQLAASERPTPTPTTRPSSWTRAVALLATLDCSSFVASSRMPIVSAMPGRNMTSDASVTMSGEVFNPSSASAAAQKLAATAATGATIGSARERAHPLFEIGRRVAGVVAGAREPQE
jgi:hypothetical protein